MSLAHRTAWISPEEYLELERHGEVRHEYFAGEVFAMAGASLAHNRIAGDVFTALNAHLRGGKCEAFMNDMKAHIHKDDDWFYYPDVMVNCDPAGQHAYYCETPAVVFEVLSPETQALDRREKRLAYQSLPSLHTYVLVAQDRREVTVYRRTPEGWTRDILTVADAVLVLPELEFSLPLANIYARVEV
jgi:Uma2 family endonuclease